MGYDKQAINYETAPIHRAFPGKFPTRVHIRSTRGSVPFMYVGKLGIGVLESVKNLYFGKGGTPEHLDITEFDQNGVVAHLQGGSLSLNAQFADILFVLHPLRWRMLSRKESILFFLDRVPFELDGAKVRISPVWLGSAWEPAFMIRLRELLRGRIRAAWFSEPLKRAIVANIGARYAGVRVRNLPAPPLPARVHIDPILSAGVDAVMGRVYDDFIGTATGHMGAAPRRIPWRLD